MENFLQLQSYLWIIFFTHYFILAINGGLFKCLSHSTLNTPPVHQLDLSSHALSVHTTKTAFSQPDLLLELKKIEGHGDTIEVIKPEDNHFLEMKKRLRLFMKKVTKG